jgi:hypothetical protein
MYFSLRRSRARFILRKPEPVSKSSGSRECGETETAGGGKCAARKRDSHSIARASRRGSRLVGKPEAIPLRPHGPRSAMGSRLLKVLTLQVDRVVEFLKTKLVVSGLLLFGGALSPFAI